MHFVEKEPNQKRLDFDNKLKSNKILRVPGAYNPLTAKLIEKIGYDAVIVFLPVLGIVLVVFSLFFGGYNSYYYYSTGNNYFVIRI